MVMGSARFTDTGCHTVWTGVGDWVGWWPKGEKRVIARSEVGTETTGTGTGMWTGTLSPPHLTYEKHEPERRSGEATAERENIRILEFQNLRIKHLLATIRQGRNIESNSLT